MTHSLWYNLRLKIDDVIVGVGALSLSTRTVTTILFDASLFFLISLGTYGSTNGSTACHSDNLT